jgi:hypothetical protein
MKFFRAPKKLALPSFLWVGHGEGKTLLSPPRSTPGSFSRYNALLPRSVKGSLHRYAPSTGSIRVGFQYARGGSGELVSPAFPQESLKSQTICGVAQYLKLTSALSFV